MFLQKNNQTEPESFFLCAKLSSTVLHESKIKIKTFYGLTQKNETTKHWKSTYLIDNNERKNKMQSTKLRTILQLRFAKKQYCKISISLSTFSLLKKRGKGVCSVCFENENEKEREERGWRQKKEEECDLHVTVHVSYMELAYSYTVYTLWGTQGLLLLGWAGHLFIQYHYNRTRVDWLWLPT